MHALHPSPVLGQLLTLGFTEQAPAAGALLTSENLLPLLCSPPHRPPSGCTEVFKKLVLLGLKKWPKRGLCSHPISAVSLFSSRSSFCLLETLARFPGTALLVAKLPETWLCSAPALLPEVPVACQTKEFTSALILPSVEFNIVALK